MKKLLLVNIKSFPIISHFSCYPYHSSFKSFGRWLLNKITVWCYVGINTMGNINICYVKLLDNNNVGECRPYKLRLSCLLAGLEYNSSPARGNFWN